MSQSGDPDTPGPDRRVGGWMALMGLALGLRLFAAGVTGAFHHPQLYEYEGIARSLLAGSGFVYVHHGIPYHSFTAPLYPWLCAGLYAMTNGAIAAVLIVQMVLSAANAVLIAHLASQVFNRFAGTMAGLLMACHPGLIIYSSLKAHPLTIDALAFSVLLWQFVRLQARRTCGRSLVAGLAIGVGVLSRPTSAVLLPIGILWLIATAPAHQWIEELKRGVVMSVCALIVLAPWLVRNALIHRQFVFMQSTTSELLWRGNNPAATGHSYIDRDHLVLETLPLEAAEQLRALPDEVHQARWFRDRAFSFIRAHPLSFVALTAKKMAAFWWFAPQTGVLYPRLWRWAYQAFYVVVLWLGLVGAWQGVRQGMQQRSTVMLIGLILLSVSGLQSLYYVETRHRWGIEPLLLVLAGAGAAWLLRSVSDEPVVSRVLRPIH